MNEWLSKSRPKPTTSHPVTREVAPDGWLLPHFRTFTAIVNVFSRIYSHRYDEAIRKGREGAKNLLHDAYYQALLRERIYPLGRWAWEVEADPDDVSEEMAKNPKDPRSVEREQVRKQFQAVLKRTPRLSRMRRALGWGIWYGRQGVQWVPGTDRIAGEERTYTRDYRPIMGDKIHFDFDGVPGVMIQAGAVPPGATVRYTDAAMPVLLLDRQEYRERVIVHTHDLDDADITEGIMAGRVHGVGLRDAIAWSAELRLEIMSWIFDFCEKVGNLGILVVKYEDGNAKAKAAAEETARKASGRAAIAVPVPKGADKQTSGIELIPANMTGVQFLVDATQNWFERHTERLIVGQSMSGGSSDGGGGLNDGGRAEMATDTKWNLLTSDAEDQAETLTTDWMPPLQRKNWPGCEYRYVFKYRVPDPQADKKLDAVTKVANLPGKKLTFLASELREMVGVTKPGDGDEIVGGDEQSPAVPGAMPGQPQPGQPVPGGEQEDDLFGPGEFEQLIGEAGGQGDQVPFLSGRFTVPYAAGDWETHTIQAGKRKGQQAWRNRITGEIRDDAPTDRQPGQPGAESPHSPGGGDPEAKKHVSAIRAAGPQAIQAAKSACVKVWQTLKLYHTKMLLAGVSYEDALNDLKEMSNPLQATSGRGVDHVAAATGIPSASFIGLTVVPAVAGFVYAKIKKHLAGKKTAPQQAQQAADQAQYRKTVSYAATDWEPHTVQAGENKGKAGWKHKTTGEIRYDAPEGDKGATDGTNGDGKESGTPEAMKAEIKAKLVAAIHEAAGVPVPDVNAAPNGDQDADDEEEETDPIAEAHEAWQDEDDGDEGWHEYDPKHQAARSKVEKQIEKEHDKEDAEQYKEREKAIAATRKAREKEDRERIKAREKRDAKREKDSEKETAAAEKKADKEYDKALEDFDAKADADLAEAVADWRARGIPEKSDEEEDIADLTEQFESDTSDERDALEEKMSEQKDAAMQEIEDKYEELQAEHDKADEEEDEAIQAKRDEEDEERDAEWEEEDDSEREEREQEIERRLTEFDAQAIEKRKKELYHARKKANPDAHAAFYGEEDHKRYGTETAAPPAQPPQQ